MTDHNSNRSYDLIKRITLEQDVPYTTIEDLKQIFAAEIDSIRRKECIRNIGDLIDLLERRDIISEYNLEKFYVLAKHIGNQHLLAALENIQQTDSRVPTTEFHNVYKQERLAEELQHKLKINSCISRDNTAANNSYASSRDFTIVPPAPAPALAPAPTSSTSSTYPVALTDKKRAAIYKLLSQQLGNYWRSFGRALEITEGAMDEIELQFPRDLQSRIYKLLQIYEEDECHDPKLHLLLLTRALGECKRKDLKRKVENIMSH